MLESSAFDPGKAADVKIVRKDPLTFLDDRFLQQVMKERRGVGMFLPTRAGDVRNVSRPEFNYEVADWLPDGKRLLVSGNEPGKPSRSYLQGADGGPLTPVTPEGMNGRPFRTVSLSSFGGMTL